MLYGSQHRLHECNEALQKGPLIPYRATELSSA